MDLLPTKFLPDPYENRAAFRARVRRIKVKPGLRSTPGLPHVVAITRAEAGKRHYIKCHTREQALLHSPYIIEHVNSWGQVTLRERIQTGGAQ